MMNISLYCKTKIFEFLLSFAENWKTSEHSFFHELQQIRKRQRNDSKKEYERSRPPGEASIKFERFRLIEVFDASEFKNLKSGISKLFPENNDKYSSLNDHAETLTIQNWSKLGIIVDTSTNCSFSSEATVIEKIPQYIKYISVSSQKILQSLYVVAFDFILDDEASHKLKELYNRKYLPELQCNKLFEVFRGRGYSSTGSAKALRKNISNFTGNIELDAEKWVKGYLNGFHFRNNSKKRFKLPAIEMYTVTGNPSDVHDLNQWKEEAAYWFNSFNIPIQHIGNFSNGWADFIWNESQFVQYDYRSLTCLTVFDMPNADNSRNYLIEKELDGIASYIAITSYANGLKSFIEKWRLKILKSIKKSELKLKKSNIKYSIKLKGKLMLIESLENEFAESLGWFKHFNEPLSKFKNSLAIYQNSDLLCVMIKRIEEEIKHIKGHIKFNEHSLSDYIAMQNLNVMFTLQKRILCLTWITVIVGFIGIVFNWDKIELLLQKVCQYF